MRANSLRSKLLRWLLPASIAILIGSVFVAFLIAAHAVGEAYDKSLRDAADILAEHIRSNPQRSHIELPAAAARMVMDNTLDSIWFRLTTADGQNLGGNPELMTLPTGIPAETVRFNDGVVAQQPVRIISMSFWVDQERLDITIAATTHKRDALVRDILVGISAPGLVLIFAMALLIEFGIERGLAPLAQLRQELAARSHVDLRPLTLDQVPDDLRPLVSELNQLLGRLETARAAQASFVSDAAHQLRTPVAALQAQAEILLREAADQRPSERLNGLVQSTHRLAHLVHQLLSLARAEPARKQATAVDLSEIVRVLAESLYPQAVGRNLDLGFDLEPATVVGSPILLREMISNLIDNAIRYTPAPGSITVRCRQTASEVLLEVEDSGRGIPEAERGRIFERFHRLEDEHSEGSGLGLAIVFEVARQHGGEVSVRDGSALRGALFEVRLPVV